MATRGVRIGIGGATGALGTEVLSLLDAARVPIAQIVPVASENSLGCDIDFQDEVVAVATELPALHGLDLFINCAPPAAGAEMARAALRAEVPFVDASGGFASHAEVPLLWASGGDLVGAEPLLASPVDATLAWLPVLRALASERAPVAGQATVLEAASASGRTGIEMLTAESLALFNQQDLPDPVDGYVPLAFDLHPNGGEGDAREVALQAALHRLLPVAPTVATRWVRVPVFVGQATSLRLVWEGPVDVAGIAELLAKAPGVEMWEGAGEGANLRAASGRDVTLVGRPVPDPSDPRAVRLWIVADVLRLVAANAVAIAVGALETRGILDGPGLH
jgi:aspartate-semialdehyde dehydrogenase